MSVIDEVNKIFYDGDGVETEFTFDYKVLSEAHLKVYKIDEVSKAKTLLSLAGGDYSVALNPLNVGGEITITVPPTSDEKVLIIRDTPREQDLEVTEFNFQPKQFENKLDSLTLQTQDNAETLSRTVKADIGTQVFDGTLPEDIAPGDVVGMNTDGDGLEVVLTKDRFEAVEAEIPQIAVNTLAISENESDITSNAAAIALKANTTDVPGLAPVQSVAGKIGDVILVKSDVGLSVVDNTSDAQKALSGPIKDALDALTLKGLADVVGAGFTGIAVVTYNPSTQQFEAGASGGGGAVDSVNGQIGVVVLNKSDIGLANVDNTSDANKPVSTAQQTALNLKANAADLNNVDNTSDANKPISSATQTALNLKANLSALPTEFKQLESLYSNEIATGSVTVGDFSQWFTFVNCTDLIVPEASIDNFGRIIILGSSNQNSGAGETVPISDDAGLATFIGNWEATPDSFGYLVCERTTNATTYAWRIVNLKEANAANRTDQQFSGDGSTTAFTLSSAPGSAENTDVTVTGLKFHRDKYSISGTTLTFVTAPPTGTNNIEVTWGTTLPIGVPADGSVEEDKIASNAVTPGKLSSAIGYIEESGSNANGEWTKFSDGRMICTHEFSYSAPSTAVGSIFNSSEQVWTFPQTFTSNPQISMNDVASTIIWFAARTPILTSADFRAFCYTSVSGTRTVTATAIGRWK